MWAMRSPTYDPTYFIPMEENGKLYFLFPCEIPPCVTKRKKGHIPKPCGPSMTMRVYVDANHAGDLLTRRSRTGFIVFLNGAPIYWSSKKQTSSKRAHLAVNLLR